MGSSRMPAGESGTVTMSSDKATLSTGKYQIRQTSGAAAIFATNEEGAEEWIASCPDPVKAMEIVEGLVLVEMKRFYYPDSTPEVTAAEPEKPVPPFLQRK